MLIFHMHPYTHTHIPVQFSVLIYRLYCLASRISLGLEVKVGQKNIEPNQMEWEGTQQKVKGETQKKLYSNWDRRCMNILKRKFINDLPCGKCY